MVGQAAAECCPAAVERSISKMKLIKNRLRTSMCNDRLPHMVPMSIELDILREINFEDLVTEFAKKKSRKVSLQTVHTETFS